MRDRRSAALVSAAVDGDEDRRRSAALVSATADGDEDQVRPELINYAHPDSADSTSVTALDVGSSSHRAYELCTP